MDRYSAVCMNLIAGHRATKGNYNEPENIGVFLNDLPAQNRLTVRNSAGTLLKNAKVRIYQAVGQENFWYSKRFDNIPDLRLTTDDQGQVLLGRNPFSGDEPIQHTWEVSNAVIIVRVEHDGRVGYTFLEVSQFNLEYWRGNTELGEYEIRVNLNNVVSVSRDERSVPSEFSLKQNYPNPFNASTQIEYELPSRAQVILKIYDLLGREIRTLVEASQNAGNHAAVWDGKNDAGQELSSGLYVYKLSAGNHVRTKKLLLLK